MHDYHLVLEQARAIQHTFGDNSLTKAVHYVLKCRRKGLSEFEMVAYIAYNLK